MITLMNPPTQREMEAKCGMSLGTVNTVIAKFLKA